MSSTIREEDDDVFILDNENDAANKQARRRTVLNSRASILNFSRRQSKSMVGISFDDQISAIDPSLPAAERLSRLLRLAVSAAGKEVSLQAEEDSNVDLADAISDTVSALDSDCFADYDVDSGVKLIQSGGGSAESENNREEYLPPHVKAFRDYERRVETESSAWKALKERRKEEYSAARKEKIATLTGQRWISVEKDLPKLPEEERRVLEALPDGSKEWDRMMEQERRLLLRKRKLALEAQTAKGQLREVESGVELLGRRVVQRYDDQLMTADGRELLRPAGKGAAEKAFSDDVKRWKKEMLENNQQ